MCASPRCVGVREWGVADATDLNVYQRMGQMVEWAYEVGVRCLDVKGYAPAIAGIWGGEGGG